MPVFGHAEIRSGQNVIETDINTASVLNPSDQLSMNWSADCDQLMLRLDKNAVEQACSQQLGRPIKAPLLFNPELQWQKEPIWRNLMIYLTRLLQEMPTAISQPLITQQLEQLVINTLLSIQPHNYIDAVNEPDRKLAPRHVKKVEEYIESHADEALTPGELAQLAGVSLRTLYAGFKDFRQVSPMEHLRNVRLQKVRDELNRDDQAADCSVTEIAIRWGFTHMGRFSQEYKRMFGELPSETKRR